MCKKLMALFLVLVLCSGLMIGCGGNNDEEKPSAPNLNNPPDEEQIAYDLSQFGSDALELNQLTVKSCELVKRQSNPEDKADEAHVKAICEGPFSRMELYFQLD